jgi:hypothetical protein
MPEFARTTRCGVRTLGATRIENGARPEGLAVRKNLEAAGNAAPQRGNLRRLENQPTKNLLTRLIGWGLIQPLGVAADP